MIPAAFKTYRFDFDEVRPTKDELHDFLQLGLLEEDHPALIFLDQMLPELENCKSIGGGYQLFRVQAQDVRKGIIRVEDIELEVGNQVCGYLRDSEYAALFLCTAGEEFTAMADHFTGNGDLLEAYLVDAIGSLTVERAMDSIMESLEHEMKITGMKISNRYSPGYCNWHLAEQQKIFTLLSGHDTGITLTPSSLMLPRKSVSGIIGIGGRVKKRSYGCETCNNTTCIYRKILKETVSRAD